MRKKKLNGQNFFILKVSKDCSRKRREQLKGDDSSQHLVQELSLTVSWQGRDRDGDDLQYIVRYSHDGGNTWRTMAVEIKELHIKVAVEELPGAGRTAVVQVIASDGVHTGAAQSVPFSVPKNPPSVFILAGQQNPGASWNIREDDTLALTGRGFDPEDGPLSGRSLTWLLDGEILGSGRWLHLAALEPGEHKLILKASDSDGNVARDYIDLVIDELPGPTPPPSSSSKIMLPIILAR